MRRDFNIPIGGRQIPCIGAGICLENLRYGPWDGHARLDPSGPSPLFPSMDPTRKTGKSIAAAPGLCLLALLCLLTVACSDSRSRGVEASAGGKLAPAASAALAQLQAGRALDRRTARSDAAGRLQVYVYVTDTSPNEVARLTALGLGDPEPVPSMGLVQGWMAPQDVGALAASPVVIRITLPSYAEHH